MKKTILSVLLCCFCFIISCDDDDTANQPDSTIAFTSTSGEIYPSEGDTINIKLTSNTTTEFERIASIEIASSSTAEYGSDFKMLPESEGSVISIKVNAGSSEAIMQVIGINTEMLTSKEIKFQIISNEDFTATDHNTFSLVLLPKIINEDPASFTEIGSIALDGGEAAAEISAYDPTTKQLFVVNNANTSRFDIINIENPSKPKFVNSVDISIYGGGINSVAVKNGMLATAIEANNKQENGKVVIFNTQSLEKINEINVGALPDMVTFSPDGNYILTADEGEPNDTYSNDPKGSVSIINIKNGYSVKTLYFDAFENQMNDLISKGFRIYGPEANFSQDIEPEYITVSADSKTAWVSLQENNGMAQVDITNGVISNIYPLGFKDFSLPGNEIDPNDKDDKIEFINVPVKGIYQPDALAYFTASNKEYIITANEGDTRDYEGFSEEDRVEDINLSNNFSSEMSEILQRLTITNTLGKEGDIYNELYVPGARSFSIWTTSGELVYDCGSEMERKVAEANMYDDGRSDNKGVEPEGVTTGIIDGKVIGFIGMERVDAVAVYDLSTPNSPQFLQLLPTGDAPEGIIFISAEDSPNNRSTLIVSSEDDGYVKIYQPSTLL